MTNKNTRSKKCIFIPRGEQSTCLYHNGIFMWEIPNSFFSYNVPDEWGLHGDDMMIEARFDIIEKAFNSHDFSTTHAVRYWEAARAQQETIETLRPINITNEATGKHLFDGFHKVFGKQSCIYTDFQFASHAEAMGWEIVSLRDGPARVAMHAGVKSDLVMVKTLDEGQPYDKPMTRQEKERLTLAENLLKALEIDVPIHIVKGFYTDGFERVSNHGVYRKDHKDMVIAYEVLKGLHSDPRDSAWNFIKIVLHEAGHHQTQASDGSGMFVDFFIEQWLRALNTHDRKIIELLNDFFDD